MLPNQTPDNGIATKSQTLLTDMAKAADLHWMDFSQTKNGQVLLNSDEMTVPERIKTAFIHGDIMAQTGVIADFISAGITDFLLPQRRIRWTSTEGLTLALGQEMPDIIFIERHSSGGMIVHHGQARCVAPHPELLAEKADEQPVIEFLDHGNVIQNVIAFTQTSSLLATFIQ